MISIENFLTEVSTRALHINTLLTELKNYTLPQEPDYIQLQEICTTVERIHDKIIARKMREKNNEIQLETLVDKKQRRTSLTAKNKVLSPRKNPQ